MPDIGELQLASCNTLGADGGNGSMLLPQPCRGLQYAVTPAVAALETD